MSQWELAFFGLPSNYKLIIADEIFYLCYYGKGGFSYSEIYNMPIGIRRYFLRKISEIIDNQNKANESPKGTEIHRLPRFDKHKS